MFFLIFSVSFVLCFAFHIYKISLLKLVCFQSTVLAGIILSIIYLNPREIISILKPHSTKILFDNNWQFSFDEKNWINVTLPHTTRIEPIEKKEQQWQGTCFYRKQLNIDDTSSYTVLRFDAAMHEADIWINQKHTAQHLGGYLPFDIEIPTTQIGLIDILVRLRNTDNSTIPPGKKLSELDFNYYGGLYRHVWLIKKSKQIRLDKIIRIDYENVTKTQAVLNVKFNILTYSKTLNDCYIRFSLNRFEIYPINLLNNNQAKFILSNPRLWSPSEPNLYDFSIELLDKINKKIVYDQEIITIGIRSFELKSNSQHLFVNGEKFDYIVGTNRHQEYPYIGYALSDSAQYRDAYKIKQAGFNLVRCSHYPPSSAFLQACDQLGLLVINSIPGWQYFANGTFEKNALNDIEKMIERDYNHPSIVLWEVSLNESPMSKDFMKQAHDKTKQLKPNSITCGWIDDENAYDIYIPARQHGNPPDYYKNYRAKNNKIIFISEYGDWEYYARKDNFNQLNANSSIFSTELTSRQRRKTGEKFLLQQARNFQEAHNDNRRASQTARIMGDANWLMFDYKRGYAQDIEASGIMDINRLPKFVYYFYQ